MLKINPEEEGVFFPRGLYAKEETLLEQIEALSRKSEQYNLDGDLHLLLGYQLLGIGEFEQSGEVLSLAMRDLDSVIAAGMLIDVLEKVEADAEKAVAP
jgi:uncharacterized protein HemY